MKSSKRHVVLVSLIFLLKCFSKSCFIGGTFKTLNSAAFNFFCLEKLRRFSGVVICWEIAAEKFTSINPSVSFYSACQHLKLLGK